MTKQEHQTEPSPTWQADVALFEGTFRYSGNDPQTVRVAIAAKEERYHLSRADQEIEPVATQTGTRTYLFARFYTLEPDIILTVDLFPFADAQGKPRPRADDGAIGKVVGSDWQGMRHRQVGKAQSWYYPTDRTFVIWECFCVNRLLEIRRPSEG